MWLPKKIIGTFSHLVFACLSSTANREQPLPWGRTGHGAPPCKWSPGFPGPHCSCCTSSPCSDNGPLRMPEGSNDCWSLGMLQGQRNNLDLFECWNIRCKVVVNNLQCHKRIHPRLTVLSVRNIHSLCNTLAQFMPFCVCLCLWIWSGQP